MRKALLAVVMTIGLAASALAADVTGKWVGNVETPNGPLELTYEFKAEGEECVELLEALSPHGRFNYSVDCRQGLQAARWVGREEVLSIIGSCASQSIEVFWRSKHPG